MIIGAQNVILEHDDWLSMVFVLCSQALDAGKFYNLRFEC